MVHVTGFVEGFGWSKSSTMRSWRKCSSFTELLIVAFTVALPLLLGAPFVSCASRAEYPLTQHLDTLNGGFTQESEGGRNSGNTAGEDTVFLGFGTGPSIPPKQPYPSAAPPYPSAAPPYPSAVPPYPSAVPPYPSAVPPNNSYPGGSPLPNNPGGYSYGPPNAAGYSERSPQDGWNPQHHASGAHPYHPAPPSKGPSGNPTVVTVEHVVKHESLNTPSRPQLRGHGLFFLGFFTAFVLLVAIYSDPAAANMGVGEAIRMNAGALVRFEDVSRALLVIVTALMTPVLLVVSAYRLAVTLPSYIKWAWEHDEISLFEMGFWVFYFWLSLLDSDGKKSKS